MSEEQKPTFPNDPDHVLTLRGEAAMKIFYQPDPYADCRRDAACTPNR